MIEGLCEQEKRRITGPGMLRPDSISAFLMEEMQAVR